MRSLCSSIPLSLTSITPHPTGIYKHPRKPLRCQTDTEHDALNFRFGRGKPPPLCDIFVPASYQHQHPLPLITQVPTNTHASHFIIRPIPSALRFGGAKPPILRDHFLLPSYQHQHPLPLTPQVPTIIHASFFNPRLILSALRSVFCLAGQKPHPLSISRSPHRTTSTT